MVIYPIFGQMVFATGNSGRDLQYHTGLPSSRLFPVLTIYEVWQSSQRFFSLLGMLSNLVFFLATTGGSLCGGLLTRWMYIHPHYRRYVRKADVVEYRELSSVSMRLGSGGSQWNGSEPSNRPPPREQVQPPDPSRVVSFQHIHSTR